MADISHDYDKFFKAMIKFAEDFDHDWGFAFPGLANQVTITFIEDHRNCPICWINDSPDAWHPAGQLHQVARTELGDDIAPQFIGGKFLE